MNYSLTDSEQKIMDILWKYAQWMTIAELGAELEKDGSVETPDNQYIFIAINKKGISSTEWAQIYLYMHERRISNRKSQRIFKGGVWRFF